MKKKVESIAGLQSSISLFTIRKTKRGERADMRTGMKVAECIRSVPESRLNAPPIMNIPGKNGYALPHPSMER